MKIKPKISGLLAPAMIVMTIVTPLVTHADSAKQYALLSTRLDTAIEKAIDTKRIVGTVVLVAKDGKVVYQRAAGMANRELAKPMTLDTLFRLSSVTKPLVSAAAMRMVEESIISLDDPVSRWLPDFAPKMADGSLPVITVRQLLNHTSGLSYGFFEAATGPYHQAHISDGLDLPGISLTENLARLSSVPLFFEPGSAWQYSLSIDVLGALMSAAAKQPLPELVHQYITAPLNMNDTTFVTTSRERVATAYVDAKPEPRVMQSQDDVFLGETAIHFDPERAFSLDAYPSGGAGMIGSAPDFMRFLLAIRYGGQPILQKATVAEMMQNQIGTVPPMMPGGETGQRFGYGWSVLDNPEQAGMPQGKGTISWGGVYGHHWFYDPVNDWIVVVFTNTSFEGMSGQYTHDLRDAVYSISY